MKKYFLYFIIFLFFNLSFSAKASYESQKILINNNIIKKNLKCDQLVDLLGGLNKIKLLWLGNKDQKKFQYALINTPGKNKQKIFYLCENLNNKKITSDDTMQVLSERNLFKIYFDSKELFTDIFSVTSKESRNYIMSTLNLRSFNISKNEINQAYIGGLMKMAKVETDNYSYEVKVKGFKDDVNAPLYFKGKSNISYEDAEAKAFSKCKRQTFPLGISYLCSMCEPCKVHSTKILNNGVEVSTKIAEKKTKPKKKVEIVKVEEPKQEEFVPKKSSDKTPPKIIISEKLTTDSYNYQLTGVVKDEGSKNIYVEIDGVIQQAKNGRFSFERFSVVDEKVAIVAIDQWGNRSKEKIINVKVEIKNTEIAKKLEQLDPSKVKSNILNTNKVALIIGIENYASNPKATYANYDAKYFYQYAKNIFGVKSENIKLLVDEEANLVSSLGVLNKWLPGKIKKNHTELIIFFAGHGLASSDGEKLYLLPQDGDSDLLARTAISREEIFQIVSKLKPKSVTVFFDTCYSGVSRDEETLLASARPVRIVADEQDTPDNFTIFSASQLDQISSGLKEAKHGIFSYYLMKGLEGNADSNNDKKITNGELIAYMDENVSQKASELGRQQNPSLAGDPDKVLMSYR